MVNAVIIRICELNNGHRKGNVVNYVLISILLFGIQSCRYNIKLQQKAKFC